MGLFSGIKKGFKKVWGGIKKGFAKIGGAINKVFGENFMKYLGIATMVFGGVGAFITGFQATAGQGLMSQVMGGLGNVGKVLVDKAVSVVKTPLEIVGKGAKSIGLDGVKAFTDNIATGLDNFNSAAGNFLNSNTTSNGFGIKGQEGDTGTTPGGTDKKLDTKTGGSTEELPQTPTGQKEMGATEANPSGADTTAPAEKKGGLLDSFKDNRKFKDDAWGATKDGLGDVFNYATDPKNSETMKMVWSGIQGATEEDEYERYLKEQRRMDRKWGAAEFDVGAGNADDFNAALKARNAQITERGLLSRNRINNPGGYSYNPYGG